MRKLTIQINHRGRFTRVNLVNLTFKLKNIYWVSNKINRYKENLLDLKNYRCQIKYVFL